MELNVLMDDIAASANLENCSPDEDGVYRMLIDNMPVTICETNDGQALLMAEVGEPPANSDRLYRVLLEAMQPSREGAPGSFSVDPDTGKIGFHQMKAAVLLDSDSFKTFLGDFVNALAQWRRFLVDYRPVAEGLESAMAEPMPPSHGPDASMEGFLQI